MTEAADPADSGHLRLARLVGQRRRALGLSVSEAARRAGVNRATWTGVEQRATDAEDYTYAKVEQVLEWRAGSVAEILDGGSPVELPSTGRPVRSFPEPDDHIGRWEQAIIDEIWASTLLSDTQKEDMTARARAKAAEARVIEDRLRRAS